VTDHYYQPLVNPKRHLLQPLSRDRPLPGIDMNISEQLHLLSQFRYNDELLAFPINQPVHHTFYYDNHSFLAGDAEYLYNMIRHFRPRRIIEIGSGHSTLMAINAVKQNIASDASYACEHICIEPYEMPWLEKTGVKVIRQKVEDVDKKLFETLQRDDILFIDSSHIIRPQGDVLFEYLEVLPVLNPGVLVHIHDIFTPKDYLDEWIYDKHLLWNEQYLLEAFLTFNQQFRIIGALNYLMHHHYEAFAAKCPVLAQQGDKEPGSFWIVKK
jgi:predicted O-methyltransferase YrrM